MIRQKYAPLLAESCAETAAAFEAAAIAPCGCSISPIFSERMLLNNPLHASSITSKTPFCKNTENAQPSDLNQMR